MATCLADVVGGSECFGDEDQQQLARLALQAAGLKSRDKHSGTASVSRLWQRRVDVGIACREGAYDAAAIARSQARNSPVIAGPSSRHILLNSPGVAL
ncbi:hypothetical protein ASD64_14800 [Mesorhizobium sp. Root157]|nr:hypothetical protein ASD64_14800 [Mesorhizobium sp. Root157]